MSNIKLVCGTCNSEFEYSKGEYNRQTKKGRTVFYCSIKCAGKRESNVLRLKNCGVKFVGGENKLVTDKDFINSSMNEFLRRIKNREKHKPEKLGTTDLTLDYLIKLWNQQNGLCQYTGVKLTLPSYKKYKVTNSNYKASLDRVDSSKGYLIGNIQFVSYTMNNLKSNMNEVELQEFFKIIKKSTSFYK
jgi:hypothetical protein